MATELSRVDRLTRTYTLADYFPGGAPSGITAASLALLPPRGNPTAATVWTAATYASGAVTVLLAGPDADSTGALVATASADLWAKVTTATDVDAVKLERITVLGGGAALAAPTGVPVVAVNGKTGAAVNLTAADVGADAAGAATAAQAAATLYASTGLAGKQDKSTLDADVATKVGTPGSATDVALRAAFAAVAQPLRPQLNPLTTLPVMAAPANIAGHAWTNSGTTGTVDLNNFDVPQVFGAQSVKMVTNGAGASTCHVTAPVTLDMTDRDPVLWVYIDDVSKLDSLDVRLGDATFANFFLWQFEANTTAAKNDRYVLSGKWHRLTLPWGALAATGNLPRASIKQVRVTPHDNGTGAVTVRVAGFGYQPQPVEYPNGVCCFTFDDGWATGAPVAAPILDQYGFPATALPIVDLIGTNSGYMDLTALRSLQNDRGWEIGGHANTVAAHNATGGFTGITAQALDDELRLNKKWLVDNGFARPGVDVTAYPQGFYNDAVIAQTRLYFGASRSQHSTHRETVPPAEPFRIRTMNLGNTVTLAQAKAAVDEAAANRELVIFTIHQLVASPTTGSMWATTDFAALAAYVASKGVAVKTLGAVLRRDARVEPKDPTALNPLAGQYFIPVSAMSTGTSNALGTGNMRAIPWQVRRTITLSSIAAEITAVGDVGGKVRLGIYADNGSGLPGSLVVDAGQIASDAVAVAEVVLSTPVTLAPGIYWLAAVSQNVTTTQPTLRTVAGTYNLPVLIPQGTALPAAGATTVGVSTGAGAVTGALPATWPGTPFQTGSAARVILKAA